MSSRRLLLVGLALAIAVSLWMNRDARSPEEIAEIFRWSIRGLIIIAVLWRFLGRLGTLEQPKREGSPQAATQFEPFRVPWGWVLLLAGIVAVVWLSVEGVSRMILR